MRGFTKELFTRLDQRCTGMEFATEMIIKASLFNERIAEVPVTLHPDGRSAHAPHLRTFRDGWRTLRLFLMYCPRWLFLIPGLALVLLGLIGYAVALPATTIAGVTFDAHTLLFSSLAILCGYQAIVFHVCAKTFAINERLMPDDALMTRLYQIVTLERGLMVALILLVAGVGLLLWAGQQWQMVNFGKLDYARTMRMVVPGVTATALGFQTILVSFFISILAMHRK